MVNTGVWTQGLCLLGMCSTTWVSPPALLCVGYFQDRVLQTLCLDWLWTEILLISASWVSRITDISHQHPAIKFHLAILFLLFKNFFLEMLTKREINKNQVNKHIVKILSSFVHIWRKYLLIICYSGRHQEYYDSKVIILTFLKHVV
jgi:hypothetical protein